MEQIVFLSEGRINILQDSAVRVLECKIAEKYRERAREIRRKNEWKNSGTGANFMGSSLFTGAFKDAPEIALKLPVTGVSRESDRLVYALNFETGGGLYYTHFTSEGQDTHIFVNTSTSFFELDVNSSGIIAVSCANSRVERHISLFNISENNFNGITDGECSDCNPKWSRKNENILYYDSAGIGYTNSGHFGGFGPRSVYRLNIKTGELDEILTGGEFEYVSPFEDEDGNLYFIRRPYKQAKVSISLFDFLTAPFKILRAIGGWFNFFSLRYTGEPLNTAGANPAKANQKSQQQIFIDGNLLEAEKNLKLNLAAGDKNPGYAPRNWELVKKSPGGEEKILQKSVISYCVTNNGIVYSNGKYIISENKAVKAHLATKLIYLE
ncbi:MAG: hypothetical protein FWE27_05560 [Defluviitaleaceae bacterium]|nr:hypothetical protein [Defluviitaleaceae bacterium]